MVKSPKPKTSRRPPKLRRKRVNRPKRPAESAVWEEEEESVSPDRISPDDLKYIL